MVKCSNCGREIDYLEMWSKEWVLRHVTLLPLGRETNWFFPRDCISMGEAEKYQCPECKFDFSFKDGYEAVEFLKGDKQCLDGD